MSKNAPTSLFNTATDLENYFMNISRAKVLSGLILDISHDDSVYVTSIDEIEALSYMLLELLEPRTDRIVKDAIDALLKLNSITRNNEHANPQAPADLAERSNT
ncbi:hypothetical protein LJC42_00160 [Eubacteriales bacterium OttesenSCG-928-K08]|nr:hypothetical protein [Eubacteriales bacterium OttesenSCG-928-K08]